MVRGFDTLFDLRQDLLEARTRSQDHDVGPADAEDVFGPIRNAHTRRACQPRKVRHVSLLLGGIIVDSPHEVQGRAAENCLRRLEPDLTKTIDRNPDPFRSFHRVPPIELFN